MKAFVDTEVSRAELLTSVRQHQEADRIAQGQYWNDGRGCSIGCWLHDFRPGHEGEHSFFARLFGVDERLAHLADRIFEGLQSAEALRWPLRLAEAIPEGCDTGKVVDRWMLWLLSGAGTPIGEGCTLPAVMRVAELFRRRLADDEPTKDDWAAARAAAGDAAWAAAGDAARAAAGAAAGDAAGDAARAAAWAAAGDAARDAAWAAAGDAARDAAWAAAGAAARAAARDAAWAAAWKKMARRLIFEAAA